VIDLVLPLALAALVLAAAFWYYSGRQRSYPTSKQANLEWLALRRQELQAEDPSLTDEAALRLIEEGIDELPEADGSGHRIPVRGVALGVVLACGFGYWVYSHVGAQQDLAIAESLAAIDENAPESDVRELVSQIEERLRSRPDNLDYLGLLGGYYMGQGQYPLASQVYSHMVSLAPEAPQLLAYAAQARYLANNRTLDEQAELWADQAVSLNPRQQTALGLLGMAAFEKEDYGEAIKHWRVLRAMSSNGSTEAEVLDDLLARAASALGIEPSETDLPGGAATSASLTLDIAFSEAPSSSAGIVFLVVRDAGVTRGMPIAVKRLQVSELPTRVILTDSDSMAGQKLSARSEVSVSAHLSLTGSASSADAPFKSESLLSVPVSSDELVSVILAPNG
jgi:cytochrome c-type biogenesis protein CcmH